MQKQKNVRKYFLWRTLPFYLPNISHHFTARLVTGIQFPIKETIHIFDGFLVIAYYAFSVNLFSTIITLVEQNENRTFFFCCRLPLLL